MVLHLTLKKQWFDLIKSGQKREEYRELKAYWLQRLVDCQDIYWGGFPSHLWAKYFLEDMTFYHKSFDQQFRDMHCTWKPITFIVFRNGYSKDSPTVIVRCNDIRFGEGVGQWGGSESQFIIQLGKEVDYAF